jgi:sarcosine oxidase gamma subunit
LSANCPLDLRDQVFTPGTAARSLLGAIDLFVQRLDDVDGQLAVRLIVDQAMAAAAIRLLCPPERKVVS